MDVRDATAGDIEAVRAVALESLKESYGHALEESLLEDAVDRWYDPADLSESLDDEDAVFVVAVAGGEVVGFAQSYVSRRREDVGEIDWLHVAPSHRGEGVGSVLLSNVEGALLDRGVSRLEGRVLEANASGTTFYEEQGYDALGDRQVRIGDETFAERAYTKFPAEGVDAEVVLERRTAPDGGTVYVAYDEPRRGSKGAFYAAFLDENREERYGWFCSVDERFEVAMDSMERLECAGCGNRSKATRWDAAYL
jgi:GNAT superfamily N-acetyltransferase